MAITLKTDSGKYAILAKDKSGKVVDVGYRYDSEESAKGIISLADQLKTILAA